VRLAFGGLQRVTPATAALCAERLFFTPARERTSARARALLASGRRFDVRFGPSGLAAWTWGSGPAVLLVHGWSSRGAHLGAFVPPLIAAGYSVVAFDAPAHGDSPGRTTTIPQMAAALREVARVVGDVHGLVAHSIGGPVSSLALRDGLRARRVVFLAPAAEPSLFTQRFGERLGLGPLVVRGLRERAERRVGLSFEQLDLRALAPTMTTPLLVLHDREDDEVPWSQGAAIAERWPGARLVTTTGMGHRRILRDPDVVAQAVDFLATPEPPG
jgi:pimeloyl-ACP methyl ester carboxylesterase